MLLIQMSRIVTHRDCGRCIRFVMIVHFEPVSQWRARGKGGKQLEICFCSLSWLFLRSFDFIHMCRQAEVESCILFPFFFMPFNSFVVSVHLFPRCLHMATRPSFTTP